MSPTPYSRIVAAVIHAVQSAPGAPHRLAMLGKALGTSPYHIAHVFRAQTGLSVHRYLLRFRIAVALDCLASGAPSLSPLAFELGFSSHSHFSAVFRHELGQSPVSIRGLLRDPRLRTVASERRAAPYRHVNWQHPERAA